MLHSLTIIRPWIGLVAAGHKHLEIRPVRTHHRGLLALHAGQQCDLAVSAFLRGLGVLDRTDDGGPAGAVVAVATVVGCRPWDIERDDDIWGAYHQNLKPSQLREVRERNLIGRTGAQAWELEHVVRIPPVHCRGHQGMWILPDNVEAVVRSHYAKGNESSSQGRLF